MLVGGIGLIILYKFASSGLLPMRRGRGRVEYRRDDDPFLFWGHVFVGAFFFGLFFVLGLAGLIWKIFHPGTT